MGGNDSNKVSISTNSIQSLANLPLEQTVEKFWKTEYYGTKYKETSSTFSKEEKRVTQVLGMTLSFVNNHYSVKTLVEERPNVTNQQRKFSLHIYTH